MQIIRIFTLILFLNSTYSQSDFKAPKIGLIVNIDGPHKIIRNAADGTFKIERTINLEDKEYNDYNFFNNEKVNPILRITEFYSNLLKSKGFEVILIDEKIAVNAPPFLLQEEKFPFPLNKFKEKYDVEKVFIITGFYGYELEKVGVFNGDKRTNININTYYTDIITNDIYEKFHIAKIYNIKKPKIKNEVNSENIIISMDELLEKKIYPKIKTKIDEFLPSMN